MPLKIQTTMTFLKILVVAFKKITFLLDFSESPYYIIYIKTKRGGNKMTDVQFKTDDKGVYISDKDIDKYIPFDGIVKYTTGSYNNKFIVRVAHKNGLYVMYSSYRRDQDNFLSILEKGCGGRKS